MMTERTRNYFDRMADGWDRGANDDDLRQRMAALVARFCIPHGGWVLDVGTGTGILHPFLLSAVGKSGWVLAFDFSSCMLAEALKKSCPENLACFQADVTAIPLPDGICDNVICFAAFPHFGRKHEALQEMARVTRPGGRVIVAHLMSRSQIARHHDANPEVAGHYLPPDERMRQFFTQAGLDVMTIEDAPGRYLAMAEKRGD